MDNVKIDELKSFVVPKLYGHDKIKEVLLLQLVGDEINILLTGDNVTGKTTILKSVSEIDGGKYLEYQKIPHEKDTHIKSVLCIDDAPAMSVSEQAILLDLLDNNKILMTTSPILINYDPYETLSSQIRLPKNILNKFDMIFILRDIPNKDKDYSVLSTLFGENEENIQKNYAKLREHITLAKQKNPLLDNDAKAEIREYYHRMQQSYEELEDRAITYHIANTLIKLSKAYAKLLLKDKVTKEEVRKAIDLTHFMICMIGIIPETGKLDIDRIYTKYSSV